jgi:hypothetical protein
MSLNEKSPLRLLAYYALFRRSVGGLVHTPDRTSCGYCDSAKHLNTNSDRPFIDVKLTGMQINPGCTFWSSHS